MKKMEAAEIEFTKAIEINPKLIKPVVNRMYVYRDTSWFDQAINDSK